jgi:hypothetical protein
VRHEIARVEEETGMSKTKRLLFEIEGAPRRQGLFKKLRSYAGVFDSGIRVELAGGVYDCALEDIFDVYVKEPVTPGVDTRTTVIEFYREGKPQFLELGNETFPGLAEKTEHVLKNEWSHLLQKRDYPKTVKWFVACCAVVYIASEQNPHIFGSAYRNPETAASQREVLRNSWGFNDASDLKQMLPKLMDGRSVAQWRAFAAEPDALDADERALYDAIMAEGGEICFWAWDWQRLIFISSLGYLCEWLSYEESLNECLSAGQKLRGLFQSWDEFMRCYLLGYCFWAGEDPADGDSETAARRRIYEYYKRLPQNPWSVAWDLPLQREW